MLFCLSCCSLLSVGLVTTSISTSLKACLVNLLFSSVGQERWMFKEYSAASSVLKIAVRCRDSSRSSELLWVSDDQVDTGVG